MTVVHHAEVGSGRVTAPIRHAYHSGRYEIRVPAGFAILDTCKGGDPCTEYVTTEPLRWHPAYWLWRWRNRKGAVGPTPHRPTRVVRPWEERTMSPDVPPIDWANVDTRGIRGGVWHPSPSGVIPGRPGQEINSGGDTFIPPVRPEPDPRLKDRG